MHDKECRKMLMRLTLILRKKKIIDDKDMKELFGKPEEISLKEFNKLINKLLESNCLFDRR